VKPLIEVTRENATPLHSMYLRYSREPVSATKSLDGEDHFVNVDFDAHGEIVGIEIVAPDDESVDLVSAFAHENRLSLAGVFVPTDIGA